MERAGLQKFDQEHTVASEIYDISAEYREGITGAIGHLDISRLVLAANQPDGPVSPLARSDVSVIQMNAMRLLVPRYQSLAVGKDRTTVIAETAAAIGLETQRAIATTLFQKVSAEIDSPTGLTDASRELLSRYAPANQEPIIDLTHRLYQKSITDHTTHRSALIIQHDGEAFGHVGGDRQLMIEEKDGTPVAISLDEYKVLLFMNERDAFMKKAHKGDESAKAALRAVEDLSFYAYGVRCQDVLVPTRLGKTIDVTERNLHDAWSVVRGSAKKTAEHIATVDRRRAASAVAAVSVAGAMLGANVANPASAQAAERAVTRVDSVQQSGQQMSGRIMEEAEGIVVDAAATEQAVPAVVHTQSVGRSAVVVNADATPLQPEMALPNYNLIPVADQATKTVVEDAVANGSIGVGAAALAEAAGGSASATLKMVPVHKTIDAINARLAKNADIPPEAIDIIRNMLVVSAAAVANPNVLNGVSVEQWSQIDGSQDSVAAQTAITELTTKHLKALSRQVGTALAPMTADQREQLALLLASSEHYATYQPGSPATAAATPEQSATTSQGAEDPAKKAPKSSIYENHETKTLDATAQKAIEAVINRGGAWENRGRAVLYLMKHGDFTLEHASAAVGNFMVESKMPGSDIDVNPKALQYPSEIGKGIVQWTDGSKLKKPRHDRWQDLLAYAKARNQDPWDLDTQLGFILHEFATTEARAGKNFRAANTLDEATLVFLRQYERAGNPHGSKRLQHAHTVFDAITAEKQKLDRPAPAPQPSTPTQPSQETPVAPAPPTGAAPTPAEPEVSVEPVNTDDGLMIPVEPEVSVPEVDIPPVDTDQTAIDSESDVTSDTSSGEAAATEPEKKKDPKNTTDKLAMAQHGATHETIKGEVVPTVLGTGKNQVVYQNQHDEAYANKPYTVQEGSGQTISTSGCGPTSEAIVLSTLLDKHISPKETAEWNVKHGYRTKNSGTDHDSMKAIAKAYGVTATSLPKDEKAVKQFLETGGKIIVNGSDNDPATPATRSGHVYVVRGVTDDGKFLVADPNKLSTSLKAWDPEDILQPATLVEGYKK